MIGSSNAVIKTGGGTPSELSTTGIDFIDYDGTVLAHYDSVPTTLPPAPAVEGLDFQEWNWTLEELQEYFTAAPNGYVCVGATRAPSDGKTHIKIKLSDGRLSPKLWFASSQNGVEASGTIDWGDGIIDEWTRSTLGAVAQEHTYQQAGEYEIIISVEAGEIGVSSSNYLFHNTSPTSQFASYNATIKEIYFGDNFLIRATGTNFRLLQYAQSLEKVTWTSDNLEPYSGGVDGIIVNSQQIKALVMPRGFLTRTFSGSGGKCAQLSALSLPSTTTGSIGNYAFYNCYSLASINIPDGVTSIGNNAFYNCYSLASINIPDGVTSIGNNAFRFCYFLKEVHLQPTTPPTLSNANAFTNTPSDMVIYVPQGTLEVYQQATNWTTYASQMQEE